jgi:hypothetical protein
MKAGENISLTKRSDTEKGNRKESDTINTVNYQTTKMNKRGRKEQSM